MDFETDFDTDFEDEIIVDRSLTTRKNNYNGSIAMREPFYINPETLQVLTVNEGQRPKMSIGVHGYYKDLIVEAFDRSGKQYFTEIRPRELELAGNKRGQEGLIKPSVIIDNRIIDNPYIKELLSYNNKDLMNSVLTNGKPSFTETTLCDPDIVDFFDVLYEEICTVGGEPVGGDVKVKGVDLNNLANPVPEGI